MTTAETLETLIDKHGLSSVLETLREICDAKADHVQSNWQDNQLAREWSRAGCKLTKLAQSLPACI